MGAGARGRRAGAVEEPAGWAVAPEPASPPPASVGVAEASPEPTPYVDTSSGYSDTQTTGAADTGYVGEPQLGSTTAGYDTGSTGYDTGTSTGYDTGTSSGAAAEPVAESPTGYDTAATTEPSPPAADVSASSGYDSGAATGYDTAATSDSVTSASRRSHLGIGRRADDRGHRVRRASGLVRRPVGSVRAAVLGRQPVDRARLAGRSAIHRSAGRLTRRRMPRDLDRPRRHPHRDRRRVDPVRPLVRAGVLRFVVRVPAQRPARRRAP